MPTAVLVVSILYDGLHVGGSGGLMVKTHAPNLESHGSSPTSVRAFFSFPLFSYGGVSLHPSEGM